MTIEKILLSPPNASVLSAWRKPCYLLIQNCFFTFVLAPLTIYELFFHTLGSPTNPLRYRSLRIILLFTALLPSITSWSMYLLYLIRSYSLFQNDQVEVKERRHQQFLLLQSITLISLSVYFTILLICRSWCDECSSSNDDSKEKVEFPMNWHCNPYASVPVFPLDTALKAMAIPVIFNLITKGKHPYLAYFSWFLCMSALVMSAIHLSSLPAIPIIIFYAICSNIIMIDNCRLQELLNDYFGTFTKELEEQQRITEAQKITEMREVIANVAHDLKTPLSSFMTGVELVADKIMEIEESRLISRGIKTSIGASRFSFENSIKEKVKASEEGIDVSTQRLSFSEQISSSSSSSSNRFRKEFSSFTNEILDLLYNMRNTNSFMLMAINRCIDFSKANSGLKLTPKLESVNLKEAIELPLNCMSNIQNRILIHFKQSSLSTSNICSHIITDKQWLQENLLCLLSNAVKYSTEGTVTVSIDLQSKTIPQPEIEERSSISITKQPPESTERTKNTTSMSASLSSSSSSSLSVMYRRLSFFPMKKYASILPSSKIVNEGNVVNNDFPNQTIFDVESLSTKLRAKEQLKVMKYLVIEVEDSGIGMSEEGMNKLFTPFRQAQRLAGGTGLGLYSLSKRIEALNGFYGVRKRSDGQQGSVFWFSIPYRPDHISNEIMKKLQLSSSGMMHSRRKVHEDEVTTFRMTQRVHGSEEHSPTKRDRKLKILLAEDTPSIAKVTTLMLKRMGHEVDVAENGQIALNMIISSYNQEGGVVNANRYDVVLMDLQMPVMDGLEATKRLREFENQLKLKRKDVNSSTFIDTNMRKEEGSINTFHQIIIGLTATTDEETFEEGRVVGIDDFLSKPFPPDLFQAKVDQILFR